MTMVVENLNDLKVARHESAVYVKDANALLKLYRDGIVVIDLNNALKAGKICKKYSFNFTDADNGYYGLYTFSKDNISENIGFQFK